MTICDVKIFCADMGSPEANYAKNIVGEILCHLQELLRLDRSFETAVDELMAQINSELGFNVLHHDLRAQARAALRVKKREIRKALDTKIVLLEEFKIRNPHIHFSCTLE